MQGGYFYNILAHNSLSNGGVQRSRWGIVGMNVCFLLHLCEIENIILFKKGSWEF